jgi:chemotaxis signal transduction protein
MQDMHVQLRVGAERYAVSVEDAREVLELGELTPIPGATVETLGICNLDSEIMPVFDLAAELGIAREARPRRLLVVEHARRRAGLAVDEVMNVETITPGVQPADSPLLRSVTVIDGRMVGVLAVDRLLDAIQGRSAQ